MAQGANSAKVLRAVADAIEILGESKLLELLAHSSAGGGKSHEGQPKVQSKRKSASARSIRRDIFGPLEERLREARSLEEGHRELTNLSLSRRELEEFARKMEVPVRKDIKSHDLEDLIINTTVGGRLNSAAIRGI